MKKREKKEKRYQKESQAADVHGVLASTSDKTVCVCARACVCEEGLLASTSGNNVCVCVCVCVFVCM